MARSASVKTAKKRFARREGNALTLWSILTALKDAAVKTEKDGCIGLAKEVAYSFILSFFPLLLTFLALFFIFGDPEQSAQVVLITLKRMLPIESYKIIDSYVANYVRTMANHPHSQLLWFSLVGTWWTASGMISALQNAFDKIYQVQTRRSFWLRRLIALLLVLATGAPMIISTAATLFGEQLEQYLIKSYRHGFWWNHLWSAARWAIVLATVVFIAALLYRVAVERKQSWSGVLPGALLATALWLILTLIFNYYVQHFGSYDRVYGSLGAVIVLLVWMFLTALALLYGAQFNFQLERRR
jgi:membrane protein